MLIHLYIDIEKIILLKSHSFTQNNLSGLQIISGATDSAPQQPSLQIMMIIPFLSFNSAVIQIFKIAYCLENNEIHFYRYLILTKLQFVYRLIRAHRVVTL